MTPKETGENIIEHITAIADLIYGRIEDKQTKEILKIHSL